MKFWKNIIAIVFMTFSLFAYALEIPNKPDGFVNDFAKQMPDDKRLSLERMLSKFQEEKKVTIAVVTAASADAYGYAGLADMSVAIFDTWKIGNAERNSGVLVLITGTSPPYKVRITTGRGMEGTVTDLQSKKIVDQMIKPPMNAGNFSGGVEAGALALIQLTSKEFAAVPKPQKSRQDEDVDVTTVMIFGIFFLGGLATFILYRFLGGLVTFILYRHHKKETLVREQAQQNHRPQGMPADVWCMNSSYEEPRRARRHNAQQSNSPAPAPRTQTSRREESQTYVAAPAPEPSRTNDSYGYSSSSSMDSGGSTAGGGGGDN